MDGVARLTRRARPALALAVADTRFAAVVITSSPALAARAQRPRAQPPLPPGAVARTAAAAGPVVPTGTSVISATASLVHIVARASRRGPR